MPSTPTVQLKNVFIARGRQFRLHIPELACQPGDILCIAGPNGSGKSTLIACLTGLLQPEYGSIAIQGKPVAQNLRTTKALIGYIPDDEDWFIKELCAREYFTLLASIYREAGVRYNLEITWKYLASTLYFTNFDVPLQQLSHGNKKKVQIIAALMHHPKVLIMDEVCNGLDPLAIIGLEQLIKERVDKGCCVIAATHDLWWAERLATKVMLLVKGQPVLYQSMQDITRTFKHLETAFMKQVDVQT